MSIDPLFLVKASDLEQVIDRAVAKAMAKRLAKQSSAQAAALRPDEAADYIGLGRSKFYELLDQDAWLRKASFKIGTARLWRREDLDAWLKRQSPADLDGSLDDVA
jgi:excisionase family DNA binding protein